MDIYENVCKAVKQHLQILAMRLHKWKGETFVVIMQQTVIGIGP